MGRKIEDDTLYKLCAKAVNMTIDEGTIATGFSIKRCLENLETLTDAGQWKPADLFRFVAKTYIAIYCNQIGKRSGMKGKGVYFDEESLNKSVANGLVLNAEKLASALSNKADDLRAKRDAIDDQIAMDTDDPMLSLYQEMSLETLIDIILENES